MRNECNWLWNQLPAASPGVRASLVTGSVVDRVWVSWEVRGRIRRVTLTPRDGVDRQLEARPPRCVAARTALRIHIHVRLPNPNSRGQKDKTQGRSNRSQKERVKELTRRSPSPLSSDCCVRCLGDPWKAR